MPSIVFDYGSFKYQSRIHSEPDSADAAIISGSFELQGREVPFMLQGTFDLYDLFGESPVGASQDRIMLGPYLPYHECTEKKIKFPNFSSLILNSKSSRIRSINQAIIEERIRILANFFAHYLQAAKIDLNYDVILPVPAKPSYSINTLDYASAEISRVIGVPTNSSVLSRISNDAKIYQLNPLNNDIIARKNVIVIDDISTSGDTENRIREILQNGGINAMKLIAFGNTDYSKYSS